MEKDSSENLPTREDLDALITMERDDGLRARLRNLRTVIAQGIAIRIINWIDIAGSLAYAVNSECLTLDSTTERNMITEFWHALNRRKAVPNKEVECLIALTLEKLAEHRG